MSYLGMKTNCLQSLTLKVLPRSSCTSSITCTSSHHPAPPSSRRTIPCRDSTGYSNPHIYSAHLSGLELLAQLPIVLREAQLPQLVHAVLPAEPEQSVLQGTPRQLACTAAAVDVVSDNLREMTSLNESDILPSGDGSMTPSCSRSERLFRSLKW